nr:hypothetical protein [uncultured Ruminococcus sp.]
MRKCKQVVSLLLVLCMMFAVISVGIVQGAAADDVSIYTDPPSEPALLGDIDRNGKVNINDVYTLKNSLAHYTSLGYLNYSTMSKDSIEFKIADCFKDEEYGLTKKIDINDVYLLKRFLAHAADARDKGIGEPIYVDPTEPPTQAPTDEATTATITIYGLNGQYETKEFNVGDSFTVYTSLKVQKKKSGNAIQVAAASGDQNFTDSVLTLTSNIDNEQLFTDSDTVFPVFGNKAMGRLRGEGWVQYNASTPGVNDGFVFDSDDDLVIVTEYTVTKGGTGEVRNALSYLAAADNALTVLVKEGAVTSGVALTVNATFEKPVPPATEAPTEAPKPTVAPTQAPKPTVAPTEAPKPTVAPTQAPNPTVAPTQAPKPTVAPTEAPKPTAAPTQAPTQSQDKATVTVHGLDGKTETKEFNVGDDFYVYTTLNASQINDGKIGAINGYQLYPNTMIKLLNEYDEEGIIDLDDMFPITKSSTMASGHHTSLDDLEGEIGERYNHDPNRGIVGYTASVASKRGFPFNSNDDILIKVHYQVTAPGEADIVTDMRTLSASDDDLTQLIDEWEVINPNFRLHASFLPPDQQPTDGPTEAPKPTVAPTQAPKPTVAPTQAPKPTQAPTEAPTTPAPSDTYIVAGNATDIFGTSWNGNDTNNTMTKGADGIYTKQYTVDAAMKDVQLKAVKNGTTWIGDETGNNVTFNLTGAIATAPRHGLTATSFPMRMIS